MVNGLEVLNKIKEYANGKLELASFRDWIVRARLDVVNDKNGVENEAVRLLDEVEGRYAEFSDQIVNEESLKGRLAALIAPRPQSAESYLLTLYYSSSHLSASSSAAPSAANFNRTPNYQPEPELCTA